jgi:DNA-binding transcriptional regulator YiaG
MRHAVHHLEEEEAMGKVEGIIRSEIVRLAKRETRKLTVPLGREVRSLRGTLSQLRKTVSNLARFVTEQQKELLKKKVPLEAAPEEVKKARFSPGLIRALRKRLGITQKELANLAGVTVGAVFQWESGKFVPRGSKKMALIALRKLGRRETRRLLEQRKSKAGEKKIQQKRARARRGRRRRRTSKK